MSVPLICSDIKYATWLMNETKDKNKIMKKNTDENNGAILSIWIECTNK